MGIIEANDIRIVVVSVGAITESEISGPLSIGWTCGAGQGDSIVVLSGSGAEGRVRIAIDGGKQKEETDSDCDVSPHFSNINSNLISLNRIY